MRMRRSFLAGRMLAALSMTTIFAGCGTSAPVAAPRLETRLPSRPAFMAEVPVATLRAGQDARSALAIREGEIGEANSRLRRSGEWYDSVRAEAAGRGEP